MSTVIKWYPTAVAGSVAVLVWAGYHWELGLLILAIFLLGYIQNENLQPPRT